MRDLHRVGSVSRFAPGERKFVQVNKEVPDQSSATLRELVLTIAEENGEPRESLSDMRQVRGYPDKPDTVVFDAQGRMKSPVPYAEVRLKPALRIGGRYFEQKEIKCVT